MYMGIMIDYPICRLAYAKGPAQMSEAVMMEHRVGGGGEFNSISVAINAILIAFLLLLMLHFFLL